MQVIKEEVLPLFINPYDPKKAEVGKLYELRLDPLDIDPSTPEFYVFDTQGKLTNKTWTPSVNNFCMVLYQHSTYTAIMIGEDIIHISSTKDDPFWQVELVPLDSPLDKHD